VLGDVLIGVAVLLVILGMWGVYRFRTFEMRILASSKIDTVAMLVLLMGVMVRSGISWTTAKCLLIVVIVVIVNPIVTSKITAAAHEAAPADVSAVVPEGGSAAPADASPVAPMADWTGGDDGR
jgi:multicomponent Na+:H+ antiporter subunit G